MIKGSKAVYIIGSAIIGILSVLVVYFSLIGTGAVNIVSKKLVITSSSTTKEYEGTPLVSSAYSITEGELSEGHTLTVETTGSQTEVGASDNFFTATIIDENGFDCTSDYDLERVYGVLTVNKRSIVVSVGNVEKTYNAKEQTVTAEDFSKLTASAKFAQTGELLTDNGYTVAIALETPAVGTNAGTYANKFSWTIKNESGAAYTDENSTITVSGGNLVINKKTIEIQAKNATVSYSKEPYTLKPAWEFVPATETEGGFDYEAFFEEVGHTLKVSAKGNVIAGPGVSDITISDPSVADKDGNNVTNNYDIKVNEDGKLVMCYENNASPLDLTATALPIYSDDGGTFYLKEQSWDVYKGTGADWVRKTDAYETFEYSGKRYSSDYLLSTRLDASKVRTAEIELAISPFCLSYYLNTQNTAEYGAQTDDRRYSSNEKSYTFSYIPYDFLTEGKLIGEYNGDLKTYEEAYRNFVYKNYLTLPESAETKSVLESVISANKFEKNKNSVDNIKKVVQYIRTAIEYDMACGKEADTQDNVSYFLTGETKKGVCRHYATCATLLFRALGIPSRYAVGFLSNAKAGEMTEVPLANAHAWTEIYVDGLGWIPLEVTGGGFGDGGVEKEDGEGFGELDETPIQETAITLTPYTCRFYFEEGIYKLSDRYHDAGEVDADGCFSTSKVLGAEELISHGYKVVAKIKDVTLDAAGKCATEIVSFEIYDSTGERVTDEFKKVTTSNGVFQSYKYKVTLKTGSKTAEYTGEALTYDQGCSVEGLPDGFSYESIVVTGRITDVGSIENSATVRIKDAAGNDVTDEVYVERQFGRLTVTAKKITVTAASKNFEVSFSDLINGTVTSKTCNEATVKLGEDEITLTPNGDGELVGDIGGFNVIVKISGEFKGSEVPNEVTSVKIEKDGVDVTKNFDVTKNNGKLSATFT